MHSHIFQHIHSHNSHIHTLLKPLSHTPLHTYPISLTTLPYILMDILAHTLTTYFTCYHIHSHSFTHSHADSISHLLTTFSRFNTILFHRYSLTYSHNHCVTCTVHIISHTRPLIHTFSHKYFILPLTHTDTHYLTYTFSYTHSPSHSLFPFKVLTHILTPSHSYKYAFFFTHTLTHFISHTLANRLSSIFSHTHSHIHILTHTFSHTHSLTGTFFLSLLSHLRVSSVCKFGDSIVFQFSVPFPSTY